MFRRFADKDTETYRAGYPGWKEDDDLEASENLKFYQNKRRTPSYYCEYIDNILTKWKEDYDLLESHHNYIQWLFPIPERGMWECQPLQYHEAVEMKSDPVIQNRLLSAYKMMLGFYGMELRDEQKGLIQRSKGYKNRYQHLNYSGHNYLRITRILKCLGILGFEHFMFPFVYFVIDEMVNNKQLRNLKDSCIRYWLNIIRSEKQRNYLEKYGRGGAVENFDDMLNEIPPIGIIEQHSQTNYNQDEEEEENDEPSLSRPNTTISNNSMPDLTPTLNYEPDVHSNSNPYDSDEDTVLDDDDVYNNEANQSTSSTNTKKDDSKKNEISNEQNDHPEKVGLERNESQNMEIDLSQREELTQPMTDQNNIKTIVID